MEFKPLNGNVLLECADTEEIKTKSGIILNSEIKTGEEIIKAKVTNIAVNCLSSDVQVGDICYFKRNSADKIKRDDREEYFYIIEMSDILAVEE